MQNPFWFLFVVVMWGPCHSVITLCVVCPSAEGSVAKGPASKKQKQDKQRSRKDKAAQHTFSHVLLAASLKVNWNARWHWITCVSQENTMRTVVQGHVWSYKHLSGPKGSCFYFKILETSLRCLSQLHNNCSLHSIQHLYLTCMKIVLFVDSVIHF